MKQKNIAPSREAQLSEKLLKLAITENDDSIRSELRSQYPEGYVRNDFPTVSIEAALKKSQGVHDKGEITETSDIVIIRYRTSIKDDGIAIWRLSETGYCVYRWYDDID